MREQLEKRLKELKAEFESGQRKLADLEAQANSLRNMLLRISGAIQVLDEELRDSRCDEIEPVKQSKIKPATSEDKTLRYPAGEKNKSD